MPDDTFKAVLTDDARTGPSDARWYNGAKLAAYVELFPGDAVSVTAFRNLEEWFRDDQWHRVYRGWTTPWRWRLRSLPRRTFLRSSSAFISASVTQG